MAPFHYCQNSFLSASENSKKLLLNIAKDHDYRISAVVADPDIVAIYNSIHPVVEQYSSQYVQYKISKASHHSSTVTVEDLFALLSPKKIRVWDASVISCFDSDTAEYAGVFPQGRAPFYSGDREERVAALEALQGALIPYPDLVATLVDIEQTTTEMRTQILIQKQKEEILRLTGVELERQRIILCNQLYSNVGKLMSKFKDSPDNVANYFDFEMLRHPVRSREQIISGTVAGGATKNLLSQDFTADMEFTIENSGNTDLSFALVPTVSGDCSLTGVILHPAEILDFTAVELGDINNKFFNVTNIYPSEQGRYSVTFIE